MEVAMRVAAVQAAPVFLDPEATTSKVLGLMKEAAGGGATLCAFPETFLSGYPVWLDPTASARFNDPLQKAAYAAYVEASLRIDGPEFQAICAAASELGIFTYLGFIERSTSQGSVYCSLAAIHPDDGVVSVHRKLRPTYDERMVWSAGDGHGLMVHDWGGFRVGGLNCWENWMPLARYSLYAQGEQLHVATWPGSPWLTRDITRFIALEGRLYVISVGGVLAAGDIPDAFPLKEQMLEVRDRFLSGGTFIVGPDGEAIAGPVKNEETIAYADVDTRRVIEERQTFDAAGHYHRPDVFALSVNRDRQEPLAPS
jgi:nitrilase